MQALVVVLDHDLPVRGDLVDDADADPQLLHPEPLEHRDALGACLQELHQRPGLAGREVREQEPRMRLDGEGVQRVVGAVEPLVLLDVRRADQAPAQVVGPGVVRADERLPHRTGRGLVVEELRAAVAAHVVEAVQHAVLVANHEHGLAGQVAHDVVAGVRELLGPSDAHPVAEPDPFALILVYGGAGVVGTCQRWAGAPVALVVPDRGLHGHLEVLLGRGRPQDTERRGPGGNGPTARPDPRPRTATISAACSS